MESTDDAILSKTLDGTITSWNGGAEQLYGYRAEEVIGRPIQIIVPPDRLPELGMIMDRLRRGEGIDHHETIRVRRDGTRVCVALTISPLRESEGRLVGASVIARDITQRKRVDHELERRAQQQAAVARLGQMALEGGDLQPLFDTAVHLVAAQLEVEYCKVLELLPSADGVLLRAGVGWQNGLVGLAVVPIDADSQAGYTLLREEPVLVEDLRAETRFSGPQLLLDHGVVSGLSVVIHGTGQPYGVLGVHTARRRAFLPDDVHFVQAVANVLGGAVQRKQAETALRELNETLEHRVLARTAELERLNRRLRAEVAERRRAENSLERSNQALVQSNRELQEFAYVASHDLQEPLRKIRSFVDLLRADYGDRFEGEAGTYMERMEHAAERMSTLIRDLLSYSRIVTRGEPFCRTDLNEVMHGVLSDLEVVLAETEARVEVDPLPVIDADPTQMRQLLQNLIGNALKFRRPDTVPEVRVRARIEQGDDGEDELHLEVEDNGIGFDERYLERIFAPFQRLHGRSEYPGTGIGLAICRRIVDRHGGSITARSTPGEGSTFHVRVPAHHPSSSARAA